MLQHNPSDTAHARIGHEDQHIRVYNLERSDDSVIDQHDHQHGDDDDGDDGKSGMMYCVSAMEPEISIMSTTTITTTCTHHPTSFMSAQESVALQLHSQREVNGKHDILSTAVYDRQQASVILLRQHLFHNKTTYERQIVPLTELAAKNDGEDCEVLVHLHPDGDLCLIGVDHTASGSGAHVWDFVIWNVHDMQAYPLRIDTQELGESVMYNTTGNALKNSLFRIELIKDIIHESENDRNMERLSILILSAHQQLVHVQLLALDQIAERVANHRPFHTVHLLLWKSALSSPIDPTSSNRKVRLLDCSFVPQKKMAVLVVEYDGNKLVVQAIEMARLPRESVSLHRAPHQAGQSSSSRSSLSSLKHSTLSLFSALQNKWQQPKDNDDTHVLQRSTMPTQLVIHFEHSSSIISAAVLSRSGESVGSVSIFRQNKDHERADFQLINTMNHHESPIICCAWWDNVTLSIARANGDICLHNIYSGESGNLGSHPEKALGTPMCFISNGCDRLYFVEREDPLSISSMLMKKKSNKDPRPLRPRTRYVTYRTVELAQISPEMVMAAHLALQRQDHALKLAQRYQLGSDSILKQQWIASDKSSQNVHHVLRKVRDKKWIIQQSLTAQCASLDAQRTLLHLAIEIATSEEQQNYGDDRKTWSSNRARLELHLERLETFSHFSLSANMSIMELYSAFRDCDLHQFALEQIANLNFDVVLSLWKSPLARECIPTWDAYTSTLVSVPETTAIDKCNILLPKWDEARRRFYVDTSDTIEIELENGMGTALEHLCNSISNPAPLSQWYQERAYSIDQTTGMIDNTLELIQFARERGVPGLEQLHQDLKFLALSVYTCEMLGISSPLWSIEEFQKMDVMDRIDGLYDDLSAPSTFGTLMSKIGWPMIQEYVSDAEQRSSMLHDLLINRVASRATNGVAFVTQAVKLLNGLTPETIASIVLDVCHMSKSSEWPDMKEIIKIAMQQKDLVDEQTKSRINTMQICVEIVSLMQEYCVGHMPISALVSASSRDGDLEHHAVAILLQVIHSREGGDAQSPDEQYFRDMYQNIMRCIRMLNLSKTQKESITTEFLKECLQSGQFYFVHELILEEQILTNRKSIDDTFYAATQELLDVHYNFKTAEQCMEFRRKMLGHTADPKWRFEESLILLARSLHKNFEHVPSIVQLREICTQAKSMSNSDSSAVESLCQFLIQENANNVTDLDLDRLFAVCNHIPNVSQHYISQDELKDRIRITMAGHAFYNFSNTEAALQLCQQLKNKNSSAACQLYHDLATYRSAKHNIDISKRMELMTLAISHHTASDAEDTTLQRWIQDLRELEADRLSMDTAGEDAFELTHSRAILLNGHPFFATNPTWGSTNAVSNLHNGIIKSLNMDSSISLEDLHSLAFENGHVDQREYLVLLLLSYMTTLQSKDDQVNAESALLAKFSEELDILLSTHTSQDNINIDINQAKITCDKIVEVNTMGCHLFAMCWYCREEGVTSATSWLSVPLDDMVNRAIQSSNTISSSADSNMISVKNMLLRYTTSREIALEAKKILQLCGEADCVIDPVRYCEDQDSRAKIIQQLVLSDNVSLAEYASNLARKHNVQQDNLYLAKLKTTLSRTDTLSTSKLCSQVRSIIYDGDNPLIQTNPEKTLNIIVQWLEDYQQHPRAVNIGSIAEITHIACDIVEQHNALQDSEASHLVREIGHIAHILFEISKTIPAASSVNPFQLRDLLSQDENNRHIISTFRDIIAYASRGYETADDFIKLVHDLKELTSTLERKRDLESDLYDEFFACLIRFDRISLVLRLVEQVPIDRFQSHLHHMIEIIHEKKWPFHDLITLLETCLNALRSADTSEHQSDKLIETIAVMLFHLKGGKVVTESEHVRGYDKLVTDWRGFQDDVDTSLVDVLAMTLLFHCCRESRDAVETMSEIIDILQWEHDEIYGESAQVSNDLIPSLKQVFDHVLEQLLQLMTRNAPSLKERTVESLLADYDGAHSTENFVWPPTDSDSLLYVVIRLVDTMFQQQDDSEIDVQQHVITRMNEYSTDVSHPVKARIALLKILLHFKPTEQIQQQQSVDAFEHLENGKEEQGEGVNTTDHTAESMQIQKRLSAVHHGTSSPSGSLGSELDSSLIVLYRTNSILQEADVLNGDTESGSSHVISNAAPARASSSWRESFVSVVKQRNDWSSEQLLALSNVLKSWFEFYSTEPSDHETDVLDVLSECLFVLLLQAGSSVETTSIVLAIAKVHGSDRLSKTQEMRLFEMLRSEKRSSLAVAIACEFALRSQHPELQEGAVNMIVNAEESPYGHCRFTNEDSHQRNHHLSNIVTLCVINGFASSILGSEPAMQFILDGRVQFPSMHIEAQFIAEIVLQYRNSDKAHLLLFACEYVTRCVFGTLPLFSTLYHSIQLLERYLNGVAQFMSRQLSHFGELSEDDRDAVETIRQLCEAALRECKTIIID